MKRWFILGVLGLGVLASCSVKEDRSDCPCWLTVRASYPNEAVSAWYGEKTLFEGLIGQQVDRKVPRGAVNVVTSLGSFTAPVGSQMDKLYATRTHVDTRGEEAEIAPFLNKQFATVYLEYSDTEDGRVGYTLEVFGQIKGADKRTLQPVDGTFRCLLEASSGRGYEVRLPRQKNDSVVINRYDTNGNMLSPIPLGKIIQEAGFDWEAESLGDIIILADIPATSFQITVMQWDGPITMTVTI